jgi:thyroid adenoma-associated protein
MLFSTLLQRTFGTKKTKDEHHSINKLTRREFFSRFPQLYPFLLDELKISVDQLVKSTKVIFDIYFVLHIYIRLFINY